MTSRPRRQVKGFDIDEQSKPYKPSQKRKASPADEDEELSTSKARVTAEGKPGSLEWMLSSVKSPLCSIQMSNVINESTWFSLSSEDRMELSRLLPPTVYPFFEPDLPHYHPSKRQAGKEVDPLLEEERLFMDLTDVEADPSTFLTCPFFESAQTAFQDHLYSGWFARGHLQDIRKFEAGIANGNLHAPWKDETWEEKQTQDESVQSNRHRSQRDLEQMIRRGLLSEGDIIVYKRSFQDLGILVEKDVYLHSADPRNGLVVVTPPGSQSSLPRSMIGSVPIPPNDSDLQQVAIKSLEELESTILDMDGRVRRDQWTINNTWKCFSVWKQQTRLAEEYDALEAFAISSETQGINLSSRGGREARGTMFYLRGAYIK